VHTGLGDGTVPLSAIAQWLIALVNFVPPAVDEEEQEDDDDEEEEEEEDKDAYLRLCGGKFTSLAILNYIKTYLERNEHKGLQIYKQLAAAIKESSLVKQGKLLRTLLVAELGAQTIGEVFKRKVSQVAHIRLCTLSPALLLCWFLL
jgi:hypothetical protein